MSVREVSLTVNGQAARLALPARTHLADAIREGLDLTGTHLGCEHGVCGACTLLIDGVPQRSCLTLAASCEGAAVTTIEGLDADPLMAALRESFTTHHGLQCGYCTPGMLVTAYDIVRRLPEADEARIREELAGNLCRCTGYVGIVAAIRATLAAVPAGHPIREAAGDEAPAAIAPESAQRVAPETTDSADGGPGAAAAAITEADGRTELARDVLVPLPLDDLWRVLSDIERVAACLPGVTLTSIDGLERVTGRLTVAVGPIKARFEGTAAVRFDAARHGGSVTGRGRDRAGRSAASGEVRFGAESEGTGTRLKVAMSYSVTGPFAQFSRGALVAEVVSRLLDDFARNLVRAARGEETPVQAELRATGLGLRVLMGGLRHWLARLSAHFRS